MNNPERWATTGLVLFHVAVGFVAAGLGMLGIWDDVYSTLGFMGLVSGQALLIGIWAGLSRLPPAVRIIGLLCGSSYITCVAAIGGKNSADVPLLSGLFLTASAIGLLFFAIRSFQSVSIATDDTLSSEPSGKPRFSITQMLGATTAVSVLLACGQVFRWLGGESLGVAVLLPTLVGCGCTLAWLVVWATLGHGRLILRVPSALAAGCFIGLLPPLFFGGPYWRFLTWPGWVLTTEIVVMMSLLVVRTSGYRLARNRDGRLTPAGEWG